MQCGIEVPECLRSKFVNFPPIFKNTLNSKNDIGNLIKDYAEEERLLFQPRKMLIFSFTLQNVTLVFPLQLRFAVTRIHCFVEYTAKNASTVLCFQQWTQKGKLTKIQTEVLSQKQWSFQPTAPTVSRSWIGTDTLQNSTWLTKKNTSDH